MAVYIESRWNDGYIAHHASDVIMVRIIHRPEDGYLLSFDKEVIREQLPLKDFISRLRQAEGAQKYDLEEEVRYIDEALRQRKEKEICEWLDHRYSTLIRDKKAVLMQHSYRQSYYSESIGNTERSIRQSQPMTESEAWNTKEVLKEMYRQGYKVEEYVSDDEVYYTMIK